MLCRKPRCCTLNETCTAHCIGPPARIWAERWQPGHPPNRGCSLAAGVSEVCSVTLAKNHSDGRRVNIDARYFTIVMDEPAGDKRAGSVGAGRRLRESSRAHHRNSTTGAYLVWKDGKIEGDLLFQNFDGCRPLGGPRLLLPRDHVTHNTAFARRHAAASRAAG